MTCIQRSPSGPDIEGVLVAFANGPNVDGLSSVRISEKTSLFSSKRNISPQIELWDDKAIGSGTNNVYMQYRASNVISVSASQVSSRTLQTYRYFDYQSGKGRIFMMTTVIGNTPEHITKWLRYGDEDNAVCFKVTNNQLSFVIRSSVSGTPETIEYPRATWSDKLDGTGASRIDIDITKIQLWFVDFLWLGAGYVRFGFQYGDTLYYVKTVQVGNIFSSVWMSNPSLPMAYKIENDGQGPASELECICTTVISEGGANPLGFPRYFSTQGVPVVATTPLTKLYAALGIKLKKKGGNISLHEASIIAKTNDDFEWVVIVNPTNVAGTFTYGDLNSSAVVQVARGTTGNEITGGEELFGGVAKSSSVAQSELLSLWQPGWSIDGVSDEVILAIRNLSAGSGEYFPTWHFEEYS